MSRSVAVAAEVIVHVTLSYATDAAPSRAFTVRMPFPPSMREDDRPIDDVIADLLQDAGIFVLAESRMQTGERQRLRDVHALLTEKQ